jgi:hypothetical protein
MCLPSAEAHTLTTLFPWGNLPGRRSRFGRQCLSWVNRGRVEPAASPTMSAMEPIASGDTLSRAVFTMRPCGRPHRCPLGGCSLPRGEDNSTVVPGRANGSRVPQRYNITYFNLTCLHLGCWSSQLFPWWIGYREKNQPVRRSMANGCMYRETPRQPHS